MSGAAVTGPPLARTRQRIADEIRGLALTEIEVLQGAEIERPSKLHARAHAVDKAEVGGRAVIVAQGHYRVS